MLDSQWEPYSWVACGSSSSLLQEDEMLTANISREEMTCKCGCGYDVADFELLTVVQDSADFFKHRDSSDKVRIIVRSGNRCKKHNHHIGGAESSYHIEAKAIDYVVQTWNGHEWVTVTADDLSAYLDGKYPHKYGIIIYWAGRIHFDIRQTKYRKRM